MSCPAAFKGLGVTVQVGFLCSMETVFSRFLSWCDQWNICRWNWI